MTVTKTGLCFQTLYPKNYTYYPMVGVLGTPINSNDDEESQINSHFFETQQEPTITHIPIVDDDGYTSDHYELTQIEPRALSQYENQVGWD